MPGVREILGRIGGSVMAAAFASAVGWLIASEAPPHSSPPATWPYWLCAGMFVIGSLMFAGARGWLDQPLWWLHLPVTSREPSPVAIAAATPTATYEGIILELVDQVWELWRGKAWIADMSVKIKNDTAPARVVKLTGYGLVSDPGPLWVQRPRLTQDEVDALLKERQSRNPHHAHIDLKPGESRVIRVVSDAFLPYPAGEGRPYCEFVVTGGEGNAYTLPITALTPDLQGSGHPSELMRLRNLAMEGQGRRKEIQARAASGEAQPGPDQSMRYESWVTRAARGLKPWPDLHAQFQKDRTAASDRDPAQFAQRTELLEDMLRDLDDRPRRDAELLAQVRSLLAEGRSRQGELDRVPTGTVPSGLLEHVEGWEANVRRALDSRPDLCARFDGAPFVPTQDTAGRLSNQLKARLGALEVIERELTNEPDQG